MYFDSAYIAKCYLDEPDAPRVEKLARSAATILTSTWALVEFQTILHRRTREGFITIFQARRAASYFSKHVEAGFWRLLPLNEYVIRNTSQIIASAPRDLFLRSGDALHLTTARDAGETEIWTSDRHMLAAAPYFGLQGRSV